MGVDWDYMSRIAALESSLREAIDRSEEEHAVVLTALADIMGMVLSSNTVLTGEFLQDAQLENLTTRIHESYSRNMDRAWTDSLTVTDDDEE